MNKHLVFVYGTLRRGGARPMSISFPTARFVADAQVSGRLYDLGAYPGLLLNASNSVVLGEAYEVDDELLNKLDEFEAASAYARRPVAISLGTHSRPGWAYVPEDHPEVYAQRPLITSGDWLEYAQTKTDWPEGTGPDETQS